MEAASKRRTVMCSGAVVLALGAGMVVVPAANATVTPLGGALGGVVAPTTPTPTPGSTSNGLLGGVAAVSSGTGSTTAALVNGSDGSLATVTLSGDPSSTSAVVGGTVGAVTGSAVSGLTGSGTAGGTVAGEPTGSGTTGGIGTSGSSTATVGGVVDGVLGGGAGSGSTGSAAGGVGGVIGTVGEVVGGLTVGGTTGGTGTPGGTAGTPAGSGAAGTVGGVVDGVLGGTGGAGGTTGGTTGTVGEVIGGATGGNGTAGGTGAVPVVLVTVPATPPAPTGTLTDGSSGTPAPIAVGPSSAPGTTTTTDPASAVPTASAPTSAPTTPAAVARLLSVAAAPSVATVFPVKDGYRDDVVFHLASVTSTGKNVTVEGTAVLRRGAKQVATWTLGRSSQDLRWNGLDAKKVVAGTYSLTATLQDATGATHTATTRVVASVKRLVPATQRLSALSVSGKHTMAAAARSGLAKGTVTLRVVTVASQVQGKHSLSIVKNGKRLVFPIRVGTHTSRAVVIPKAFTDYTLKHTWKKGQVRLKAIRYIYSYQSLR